MWDRRVVQAYVRARLVEELGRDTSHGATARFARELGVTSAMVSQLRTGVRNPGPDTIDAAAKRWGLSHDALAEAAQAWAKDHPEESAPKPSSVEHVERPDRYPNRARAIVAARALGIDERAVALVAGMELKSEADPTPREWLDQIEARARELSWAERSPVQAAAASSESRRQVDELAEATRPKVGKKPKK